MDTRPGRKQLSHERIVETAARAIRRAGFQGVGVADIMKEAGLTHGGFYAHFASRNALLAEALERAGRDSAARIDKGMAGRQARGVSAFRALVDGYLSERHLASTESGCPVAALASEMPRQAPEVREAAALRVRALIDRVRGTLPADAATGFWTLELRTDPADKVPGTVFRFGVEEFLPERMKLSPVVLAGGVREELQRAFILHRFEQALGGAWIGLAIFSIIFGLFHLQQGADAAIAVGLLGLGWGVLYLRRRSVVASIVSHAGFDVVQVLQQVLLKSLGT